MFRILSVLIDLPGKPRIYMQRQAAQNIVDGPAIGEKIKNRNRGVQRYVERHAAFKQRGAAHAH